MPPIWQAGLTAVGALGLALILTPLAGRLGRRLGMVDIPGGRRKHTGAVARIGGIGLCAGFFLTALGLFAAGVYRPEHRLPLFGVLLGTAVVFVAGLIDDRYTLKAGPQFLAQFAAGVIACATTVFIAKVTIPTLGPWDIPLWIAYPLTVAWVMGMMNTVNFLDGLDGLAAGVGAIAAALFAVHSYSLQQFEIALYALALAAACLGFLVFNVHPARVFLGSAGAMVLGYALATLSILAPARVATALLVMAIPIVDTGFQALDRWRRGRSPTQGDRGHLHFRLMDAGLSQPQIVLGYWVFCAVFGMLALVISAPLYKLIAVVVLGLVVVAVLVVLSRRRPLEP
ncbi:MAG: undecaprenyl/decaprenyl-phosphate alpha-N-acetylglucosaminyl 1-phosphate transferase [Anaerolineales bacterium]|nr:undecaprenyl/decaprenyl-phosphate alpha-N-acetylglucosaminyl 1-phosphate transferase [Anaerolineales bacterium]